MREESLGPAIDGTRRQWRSTMTDVGEMCCYVADRRRGRPLVLVHDLLPTSSAREMRPLYECFRWRRPTFALDFPGFGLSERVVSTCSSDELAFVLTELLRKLRARHAAADIVALGGGSEPAAIAARDRALVRSLTIVEPSRLLRGSEASVIRVAARVALALGDRAARGLFSFLSTRRSVRRALSKRFCGAPDDALVDYACACARVRGAHRAPLVALACSRHGPRGLDAYHRLTVPVLVIHDARGHETITLEAFLRGRDNRFAARVSPSRGMPQFERRSETISALDRFWQSLSGAAWDQAIR